FVGQHRETSRAAGEIGAGEGRRIEIGADQPLTGARLLDFSDQGVVLVADLAGQRVCKAAWRRGVRQPLFELGERHRRLALGDIQPLGVEVSGEDITHGLLSVTSRSSTAAALPLSSVSAAMATPSRRSAARPATTSPAAALSSTMSRNGPFSPP